MVELVADVAADVADLPPQPPSNGGKGPRGEHSGHRGGADMKGMDELIAVFAAFSDRVADGVEIVAALAATPVIFAGAPDVTSGSFFRQRRGRTAMIVAGGVAEIVIDVAENIAGGMAGYNGWACVKVTIVAVVGISPSWRRGIVCVTPFR
jgi:hypothetical protein